tara:strand:- start:212 stop:448 length:237 start_codon:yes stop_codon:yes gene_type:complete
MATLGLLGYFDFDGFPSGGDSAAGYLLDAMCVSTSVAPKRLGKLTLTSKTVNSAFFVRDAGGSTPCRLSDFGGHRKER